MGRTKKQKRGQNEGTIYRRKDGRWTASVSLGDANGNSKRKSYYGRTREEVSKKLNAALNDLQKGIPVITERRTVAQFLDSWLSEVAKPSTRPKTFKTYSYLIRVHIKPALGSKVLEKLTPQDVQRFLNNKSDTGLSPKSIRHIHATLRCGLNTALKWGLVQRNVATLVSTPRLQKKELSTFTPEEARLFMESVKGDRLEALFSIALTLGLRQAEVLGLRWQDINFDARTLRVNVTLQRIEKQFRLVEPKTERSRRVLPLTPPILSALRVHRSRQLEEKLLLGPYWHDSDLVFTTRTGTPIEPRNLVRKFHLILKHAGLPRYRFHDMRHACASFLIAQGVPPRTVMDILGHSQISLTMNTYAHVMPAMKEDAIGLMDSILTSRR